MENVKGGGGGGGEGGTEVFLGTESFQPLPTPGPSDPPFPFYLDVMDAISRDPINGPRHDAYRRQQGIEYEILLQKQVRGREGRGEKRGAED